MSPQRHRDTKVWQLNATNTSYQAARPLCLCVFVVTPLSSKPLSRDFEHPVQCNTSIRGDVGFHTDPVHNSTFDQIFKRPEQVLRIDPEHRRAQASAIVERDDEPIRIFLHQPVHEMDFRTYCPLRTGR
jgi:hypothetical protein